MAKKCPPGVICFENVTIFFLLILMMLMIYLGNNNKGFFTEKEHNIVMPTQNAIIEMPRQHKMPFNIPTQRQDSNFSQLGMLTKTNSDGDNTILPLFGKQTNASRGKWNYFSMSDQNNSIRLPLSFNGKNGSDEYGIDEISNGDNVYLEGHNDTFEVTLYKNNDFTYNNYL